VAAAPPVYPNLDSAHLCQTTSIVPACPRLSLFAIISAQLLYFPSTEVRSFSHHQTAASYPQVSLFRCPEHCSGVSQRGHRIRSSLSSTNDSYLFNFQGTLALKPSRTFYIYYNRNFQKNQIFTLKFSLNLLYPQALELHQLHQLHFLLVSTKYEIVYRSLKFWSNLSYFPSIQITSWPPSTKCC